jgi:hypothetical protein
MCGATKVNCSGFKRAVLCLNNGWIMRIYKRSVHKLTIDKKGLFLLSGIDSKSPSGFNTRLLQPSANGQVSKQDTPR